jgi:hypothetical protein
VALVCKQCLRAVEETSHAELLRIDEQQSVDEFFWLRVREHLINVTPLFLKVRTAAAAAQSPSPRCCRHRPPPSASTPPLLPPSLPASYCLANCSHPSHQAILQLARRHPLRIIGREVAAALVQFLPDGSLALVCHSDGLVRIFETSTGQLSFCQTLGEEPARRRRHCNYLYYSNGFLLLYYGFNTLAVWLGDGLCCDRRFLPTSSQRVVRAMNFCHDIVVETDDLSGARNCRGRQW